MQDIKTKILPNKFIVADVKPQTWKKKMIIQQINWDGKQEYINTWQNIGCIIKKERKQK